MKKILLCLCLFGSAGILCSCKKTPELTGAVSLTIVNTLSTSFIVNFNEKDTIIYANRGTNQVIDMNNALEFAFESGSQLINIRELTTTSPPHSWMDHSMLKLAFRLPAGTIGSLFVSGTTAVPDTLFVKDAPVFFPVADSSMGIRFLNLSADKTIVSVNLMGQANGSEAGNLSYKGVTDFKRYPANPSIQQYVFEFRDASDGKLLATSTINSPGATGSANAWRYRNFTLVYKGPAAFIVKNH